MFSTKLPVRVFGFGSPICVKKQRSIHTEAELVGSIEADDWMIRVLTAAEKIALPDWWIGADFMRNRVWDIIEDRDSEPARGVDLVYFNAADMEGEIDWAYDEQLKRAYPFAAWEIRSQTRMHYVNNLPLLPQPKMVSRIGRNRPHALRSK